MIVRAFALLVALAACKSAPATPPIVQGRAERPTSPTPTIAWRDGAFVFERLPAVADDGSVVLLAISDPDGERGHANLQLELRDRMDRRTTTHEVLAVADGDAMFGPEGPTAELRARLASGNRWLSEMHGRLRLVSLTALTVTASPIATRASAEGDGVRLTIDRARLRIDHGSVRELDRQVPESWLELADRTQPRCDSELQLAGAWIDVPRRVAIVILVAGTQCEAPPPRPIVVGW